MHFTAWASSSALVSLVLIGIVPPELFFRDDLRPKGVLGWQRAAARDRPVEDDFEPTERSTTELSTERQVKVHEDDSALHVRITAPVNPWHIKQVSHACMHACIRTYATKQVATGGWYISIGATVDNASDECTLELSAGDVALHLEQVCISDSSRLSPSHAHAACDTCVSARMHACFEQTPCMRHVHVRACIDTCTLHAHAGACAHVYVSIGAAWYGRLDRRRCAPHDSVSIGGCRRSYQRRRCELLLFVYSLAALTCNIHVIRNL